MWMVVSGPPVIRNLDNQGGRFRSRPVVRPPLELLSAEKRLTVMRNAHCRNAITLFDTLVLVVIVAIVALTVIPQFVSSTSDPKSRSLEFNLHTVRSQIGRIRCIIWENFPRWPPLGTR